MNNNIIFYEPEIAPKDRVFLAFFKNWPACVTVIFDEATQEYCASILQTELYEGKWNNHYFENEHFNIEDMIKWCELPEDK